MPYYTSYILEEITNLFLQQKTRTLDDAKVSTKEERDRFHNNLYRPPTADELNELRETEDLFQNNLFRMQVCVFRIKLFLFLLILNNVLSLEIVTLRVIPSRWSDI